MRTPALILVLLLFSLVKVQAKIFPPDSIPRFFFDASLGLGSVNGRYSAPDIMVNCGFRRLCLSMRMERSARYSPRDYIFENSWMIGYRLTFYDRWMFTTSIGYSDIAFEKGSHILENFDPVRYEKAGGVAASFDLEIPMYWDNEPYPINWDIRYYTVFNGINNLNGFSFGFNLGINRLLPAPHIPKIPKHQQEPKPKKPTEHPELPTTFVKNIVGVSFTEFHPEIYVFYTRMKNLGNGRTYAAGFRFPSKAAGYMFTNPDHQMYAFTTRYCLEKYHFHKKSYRTNALILGLRYNYLFRDWVSSYYHYYVEQSWLITRQRMDLNILWQFGWRTDPDNHFFSALYFETGCRFSAYDTRFYAIGHQWQNQPVDLNYGFQWQEDGCSGGFEFRIKLLFGGAWD